MQGETADAGSNFFQIPPPAANFPPIRSQFTLSIPRPGCSLDVDIGIARYGPRRNILSGRRQEIDAFLTIEIVRSGKESLRFLPFTWLKTGMDAHRLALLGFLHIPFTERLRTGLTRQSLLRSWSIPGGSHSGDIEMSSEPVESFSGASSSGSFKDAPKRMQVASVRVMRAGSEDIVVGENSSLEGTFETQGSMFVDGSMSKADLKTTLLSIGTSGSVEGSAQVSRAEIAGSFDGRLTVSGEVILRSTSHVTGEIQCGKLVTHRGATIRAQVTVADDEGEVSEGEEETRASLFRRRQPFGRTFIRRSAPFAYGIFFTLGAIGIVSLLTHA